jgi:hypothetical protein
MIRIIVICEGQTEETFIRDILVPIFSNNEIYLDPRTVKTSPHHKGGGLNYDRVKHFVINTLKSDSHTKVTTFFDLYALDNHFPDFAKSQKKEDPYSKVNILEQAFKDDICGNDETFLSRFFPYIQPYEFEGLLFSDIEKLVDIEPVWGSSLKNLLKIRTEVETPEHINDGYETKPSQRLKNELSLPKYRKTLHGPLAIENIGIDKILSECVHFKSWYNKMHEFNNI